MQEQITGCLASATGIMNRKVPGNTSLFYGKAGLLYYYCQLFRCTGNSVYLEKSRALSKALMENAFVQNGAPADMSLATGVTGICSALHVLHIQHPESLLSSYIAQADEYLFQWCMNEPKAGGFNFLHGTAGVASYFCKYAKTPKTRQYLEQIVNHLFNCQEPVPAETEINFTLWQGISGTIHLLFRLLPLFPEKEHLKITLLHYLQLLRSHILPIDSGLNRVVFFPVSANGETGLISAPNCLFWEAGDLPVAHIFYKAYSFFGNREYKKIAGLAGAFTLTRKDAEQTLVHHPGFGNGACGTAMMYRLLEKETGLMNYRKGYEFWLNRSVQLFNRQVNENAFLNREHDLVTGLPGMALTWLNYLYNRETGLTELFLP